MSDLEALFDAAPDLICIATADGAVVRGNAAWQRLVAVDPSAPAPALSELAHPDDRVEVARALSLAAEGAPSGSPHRIRAADGQWRRSSWRFARVGERILAIGREDPLPLERGQLEAQLRVAQRMEAVGRLAGGIAHDFNNMLSVILNYAALIRQRLPESAELKGQLAQIEEAAQRSALLTRQLLTFSRHQVIETAVVDPCEIVRRVAELLAGTLGEHVQIRTAIELVPWHVRISPSQLEQVLVNLAINARDAMPHGGLLRIEAENALLPTGRWVRLVVRDTGVGMERDVAEHAFEPFFSTKPAGQGSGLGLAVVYGIVKASGGTIVIETEPGRGTTFHIHLPAVDEEVTTGTLPKVVARPRGNGEHVLVVEDEPAVRELVCKLLERYGYTAIEAHTPREALEMAESDARIDVLLTDVVMPGMDGQQLSKAVCAHRSDLPVVFMSGYAGDVIDGLDQAAGFLAKPFTPDELLSMIRSALEHAAARAAVIRSGG